MKLVVISTFQHLPANFSQELISLLKTTRLSIFDLTPVYFPFFFLFLFFSFPSQYNYTANTNMCGHFCSAKSLNSFRFFVFFCLSKVFSVSILNSPKIFICCRFLYWPFLFYFIFYLFNFPKKNYIYKIST